MTSTFKRPIQTDPPLSPRQTLPTMYDLPSENPEDPGLPDEFHIWQPQMLLLTFKPPNWDANRVFSATDLYLYYDPIQLRWYKRPDWFGVVGVPRLYEERDLRLSYVCWQEEANPFVALELLSPGTENEDLGRTSRRSKAPPTKWQVYEQILRIPYYFVFSRYTSELQAFHLVGGHYEPVSLTNGRLAIPELELSFGLWQGSYQGLDRLWVRWMTLEGALIPLPEEMAAAAEERANSAEERANSAEERASLAEQRAEQLAAQLRELGIDPANL
ncbi:MULTISPECIES: Uma2 family endonuclease [Spirulina sp. CCY15215]|uniref:Uma2 family endonuclease n=1 Tax=Spirulina sp. CCY15215 TaxID=2767591 RepID=UPI001EF2967E|nr:Uma2 family endonuclease [Spirulina major]